MNVRFNVNSRLSVWGRGTRIVMICALLVLAATPASATRCVVDVDGANDDPGQKDVTQFCTGRGTGEPFEVHASAGLDLTGIDGSNTADLCLLFDSNSDGNINVALCTTLSNDPAVLTDVRLLTCGDARSDKCSSAVKINTCSGSGKSCLGDADCGQGSACSATFQTACTASQVASDPFPAGDASPWDTVVDCAIDLDDFGSAGQYARLINMGAYSSASLNSDMSDAVLPPLCRTDSDCSAGKVCHVPSGECYMPKPAGCSSDADCAADERCDLETRKCVPGGCLSDADCPAGKECNPESGMCEIPTDDGCNDDADCATGLVCDVETGECVEAGPECTMDADCPVGQVCNALTGVCEDALPDGSCTTDADCIPTQICDVLAGRCVDPCTSDSDCEAGEVCNVETRICEPFEGCESDADCAIGEICDIATGICEVGEPGCTTDADCIDLDGACTAGVCDTSTGECVAEARNDGGSCGESGTCYDGGLCDGGECVAVTVCDPACSICDGSHCLSICGNPYDAVGSSVTVTDALFILRAAVDLEECGLCVCDVNASGSVTAVDTLKVLRLMVRLPETLDCPAYR